MGPGFFYYHRGPDGPQIRRALLFLAVSGLLAVLEKGADTLQTKMAVPASISDIMTGLVLFAMLGCEFFINYRLIFRGRGQKEVE